MPIGFAKLVEKEWGRYLGQPKEIITRDFALYRYRFNGSRPIVVGFKIMRKFSLI